VQSKISSTMYLTMHMVSLEILSLDDGFDSVGLEDTNQQELLIFGPQMLLESQMKTTISDFRLNTPVKPIKDTFMVFSKTSFLRLLCIMNGDFTDMNEYFKVYNKIFINRGK
jgi:hypothetical protein